MKLIGELGTAFTKLRLYWKYSGFHPDIKKLLVDFELLEKEPDSTQKWGLLASTSLKIVEWYVLYSIIHDPKCDNMPIVNHYSDLYLEYRKQFLKHTLSQN